MGNIVTKHYVRTEFEDLKKDLNDGSIPEVAAEYQERLSRMQNLPLHIAVTGKTGAGKSSFVNAFRGIDDDDDDEAAEVRVAEEMMKPTAYPHPSFSNIKIWDLPGIGTCNSEATEYLEKVEFERYDVFIIVSSDRFTEIDALLAKEMQRMRKKFYYVRTKIDISIEAERRRRNFSMGESLEKIRKYCEDSLKAEGEFSAKVFLVSNRHVRMYDFPLLQETMAAELPDHKRHILTLAVQIFSEENLVKKKAQIKLYIKKLAWVSCACGAVPLPGLSIVCDIAILLSALKYFCRVFGLDERSLRFLARQTGKDFTELRSAIEKTPLANTINARLVLSLLIKSALWVKMSSVGILGSFFGGASSFATTYYFLNNFLDNAVEDAQNVPAKLLK